jgi:phosphate transport system substrate-binding protein
MKKLIVVVVLLMAFAVPAFAQPGTIVEIAAGNEDFSTLVAAVQAAGLVDTLNGEGPFTVFAPTNEAFAKLPPGVVDYLLAHPDLLTAVLTYHVVPGKIMAADVVGMMGAAEVTTVQGGGARVDPATLTIEGANIVATDIEASNGVIHVIDTVILPEISAPEIDPLSVTGDINIAGSSTVGPLTEAVAEGFTNDGFAGVIANTIVGTGAGFERFCVSGETDISNASRPIRQSEIDSCRALATPREPIGFLVGIDALAVVVSESNTFATELTRKQLSDIFIGAVTTWGQVYPELVGTADDQPIQLFSPGTDSGTFDYFVEAVLQHRDGGGLSREDAEKAILSVPGTQFSENDTVLVQGVEGSKYAIGYFGFAYYIGETDKLNALVINGVEPNEVTAEDGTYPLARPLFIYSDAKIMAAKPQVSSFINYFINNVNEYVEVVGYFPASRQAARTNAVAWIANQPMM